MIEFISFVLFIFIFFVLVYKNVRLNLKLRSVTSELLTTALDRNILLDKLADTLKTPKLKEDDVSAAFLKFISDSRDWAYTYIEDVQSSLNKFIYDIEPEIKYFDEYGEVGSKYPHYYSMKKISASYKELKKLLPDDYGKIDT
jgi:hypothetical protein